MEGGQGYLVRERYSGRCERKRARIKKAREKKGRLERKGLSRRRRALKEKQKADI